MPDQDFSALIKLAQKCIETTPVVVLGSGASIPYGLPGMRDLSVHLLGAIESTQLTGSDVDLWYAFCDKLQTKDLETVLQEVHLSEYLTNRIVLATWQLISSADISVFKQILANRDHLDLSRLFRHLFNTTHTNLSVITTNYDRLAEYAVDAAGFHHYTGFGFGHLRNRQSVYPLRVTVNQRPARTVEVWKVHGSLDWFSNTDNITVGLPLSHIPPDDMTPVIVTPGIEKFRRTHDEPFRSILAGADNAIASGRGYLCIGYGFNDSHIQPKLIERCIYERIPIVVLARSLSPAAREFLLTGKCKNFLAIERCNGGSKAYTHENQDGIEIHGVSIWQLNDFLNMVI